MENISEPTLPAPPVYHYDGDTGLYTGASRADPSPLEPGAWLVPRHATLEEPPAEVPSGFAAFFRAGAWSVEPVPEQDDDLDGQQDAPEGFEPEPAKPGYFRRLLAAVVGK
ncbi:hypothetical protein [Rhodocyclus gracilis]|uniref:Phage tail protein n=1 Tax=Rhodocyclus tenuis TaxID=1066 RepID=A0A6L5JWA9_RHOTE|nr:hypothetical protein [Rhodocyclus gracilis]MQY50830.1 hypothetical protein [Rhodocyclus gracilis]